MTTADQYRARAAELFTRARNETSPMIRSEWENLAKSYLHLAEQADRNSRTDIVYEPPQRWPTDGHAQQQQQPQPKKDNPGQN